MTFRVGGKLGDRRVRSNLRLSITFWLIGVTLLRTQRELTIHILATPEESADGSEEGNYLQHGGSSTVMDHNRTLPSALPSIYDLIQHVDTPFIEYLEASKLRKLTNTSETAMEV